MVGSVADTVYLPYLRDPLTVARGLRIPRYVRPAPISSASAPAARSPIANPRKDGIRAPTRASTETPRDPFGVHRDDGPLAFLDWPSDPLRSCAGRVVSPKTLVRGRRGLRVAVATAVADRERLGLEFRDLGVTNAGEVPLDVARAADADEDRLRRTRLDPDGRKMVVEPIGDIRADVETFRARAAVRASVGRAGTAVRPGWVEQLPYSWRTRLFPEAF